MRAMLLTAPGQPLQPVELDTPEPENGQVQIKVEACGVCRTDLHICDGELSEPELPLILGHEIVGEVTRLGTGVTELEIGQRIGVPWLGYSCKTCDYCTSGKENLCDQARFTGYQINGGYAEYCIADERYCFPIPDGYSAVEAAPLLCAGLIGYRSYHLAGTGQRLGLYGFGAAAHIIVQVARYHNREVFAFTRPGDNAGQEFARSLGALWAGGSDKLPPEKLDAAIIFAPAGELVPTALQAVRKGGRVVCAGIHMSDLPSFPYHLLWEERSIVSVANLTRQDGLEFMKLAPKVPVHTTVTRFPLASANEALEALRSGSVTGAAVLAMP